MLYSGTDPESYITEKTLVLSRARWGLGFGVWGMGFVVWGVGGERTSPPLSPSEMRNLLAEAGDSI